MTICHSLASSRSVHRKLDSFLENITFLRIPATPITKSTWIIENYGEPRGMHGREPRARTPQPNENNTSSRSRASNSDKKPSRKCTTTATREDVDNCVSHSENCGSQLGDLRAVLSGLPRQTEGSKKGLNTTASVITAITAETRFLKFFLTASLRITCCSYSLA